MPGSVAKVRVGWHACAILTNDQRAQLSLILSGGEAISGQLTSCLLLPGQTWPGHRATNDIHSMMTIIVVHVAVILWLKRGQSTALPLL